LKKKTCIAQIDCTYFQGGYGILQLNNVYTCHGFLQRSCELKKDFITFFTSLLNNLLTEDLATYYQHNSWNLEHDYMQLQVGDLGVVQI